MAAISTPSYVTLREETTSSGVATEGIQLRQVTTSSTMARQVITQQPTSFNPTHLDPLSQNIYNSLTTKHMSGHEIVVHANEIGNSLLQNVQGKFVSIKGSMGYEDFVRGLIYNGESTVSQSPHLQYNSLVILDENGQTIQSKVGGIAMLTDKRLLFLSSQYFHKFSFSPFGDPKQTTGGYTMEMSCQDTTYYTPISLSLLRSIEIEGRTGVSGSVAMHSSPPPCGGLCGCFGDGCLKSWYQNPMIYSEFNEMKLRLGVLMPPWEKRVFIDVHINPQVPTPYLRDFASLLQTYAKHLK